MRQSVLFSKTNKLAPKDEVSLNAQLLAKAGFVDKLMAGVYTFLPLGLRVLNKIKNIIREEMNKINGQEILMPALTPKENWEKTGRWRNFDALFKLVGKEEKEYALGATHEEVVTPLMQKFIFSYKDLPCAVYQIQDKFRNEPRAKSGLLRGREFSMKDLYSLHRDEADLDAYYEKAKETYFNVFRRCGLETHSVEASGGTFSKLSHEFQVFTEAGEDEIYFCSACGRHQNKELAENGNSKCPYCGAKREIKKAIEVGNIFKLKTRYADAFNFKFLDEKGKEQPVLMGCYGIGPSRVMGAVVEVSHDDKGIIWPEEIAPFKVHLLKLTGSTNKSLSEADKIYDDLTKAGAEVLYDDRAEKMPGEKFADADLIGCPYRVIVSEKSLAKGGAEIKKRNSDKTEIAGLDKIAAKLAQ
ncbi:MAG: hypothetical protein HY982_01725 [Candidatus Magasanikbacteria bacterium]|nr:hypothetical protein [Candidatus Magasanikbacteria bacterium]